MIKYKVIKYQAIEKGPKVHDLFGLGPQDFGRYASGKQVISKQWQEIVQKNKAWS